MLICVSLMSLDGYTVDAGGRFDWAEPSAEVHDYVNRLVRDHSTHLYGRRMWETMRFWLDVDPDGDEPDVMRDFARLWQDSDKIVYSATLPEPTTPNTRLVRRFDPVEVRDVIARAPRDVSVSGSALAATAIRAALVDVIDVITSPVTVGGGTPAFPAGVRMDLELTTQHRFADGTTHHRYRVRYPTG